jgi:hypothetical protein
MKTICIYHSRDLDGWMSAAIVKLKYPEIELKGWDYGQSIAISDSIEKIIFVDISFPHKEMRELGYKYSVVWIDHHISAINDSIEWAYTSYNGIRDSLFAACELTWKYLFPNELMPEIVRLLGRYDCFGHKGTEEERKVLEFQYGARQCIGNPEEALHYLAIATIKGGDMEIDLVDDILLQGRAIYKYLSSEAIQVYKNGFIVQLPEKVQEVKISETFIDRKFICINRERFNPINFGINYHNDGYDGCATFFYSNGKWNFSLYNDNGKIDCSVIAKYFGGGGHKGASGMILDNKQFFKLLNIEI